jgi:phage/plasmid-associated DNA primase
MLHVFDLRKPSTLEPESGEPSILLEHLASLIPDDDEREHFLDYLAHGVQHPAQKIGHAVLVIGKQGTGKGFLIRLMDELFGAHNVRRAESEDLTSTRTERLGNCQVLAIEELDTSERLELYNRLKTWISDQQIGAEEKHVAKHDVRTLA